MFNIVSNWAALIIQVIGHSFLLGYVLRVFRDYGLGKEEFGIFGLATSIGMGINLLSFGMSATVVRFSAESLAAGDWKRLSDILSAARVSLMGTAVVGVTLMALVAEFGLGLLNVGVPNRPAAARLFELVAVGMGLQVIGIVYRGALYGKQRHAQANLVAIGAEVVRVAVVVACFESEWVRLEALGLAHAGSALAMLLALMALVRYFYPGVRLSFFRWRWSVLREMYGFGGWAMVNQASRMGLDSLSMPLISAMPAFGPEAVAALTIPRVLSRYIVRLMRGISAALRPVATTFGVRGQQERVARLYRVGTRFGWALVVPVTAVVVTHIRPLIACLDPRYEAVAYVMILYVVLFVLRSVGTAAESIILGTGRIEGLALSRVAAAVLGMGGAVVIGLWTEWGLYGVVTALFLPTAVRGLVDLPLRVRRLAGVSYTVTLVRVVLPPTLAGLVPLAVGWGLRWVWWPETLPQVFLQMAAAAVAYLVTLYLFVLTPEERSMVGRLLRDRRPAREPSREADSAGTGTEAEDEILD